MWIIQFEWLTHPCGNWTQGLRSQWLHNHRICAIVVVIDPTSEVAGIGVPLADEPVPFVVGAGEPGLGDKSASQRRFICSNCAWI